MIFLRDDQLKAVKSVFLFYKLNEGKGAPLIVAPTGSGKSYIIAGIVREFLEKKPSGNVLVLAHRQELVMQNSRRLINLMPDIWPKVGIYAASIGEKRLEQITFAMIQSIYDKSQLILDKLGEINLIIVDECHLIPKEGEGMYLTLLGELRKKREKMGLVGLTATPFRLDAGVIYGSEKSIFTDICFDIELRRLIDEGILCRLTSKGGIAQADFSNVKARGGDYVLKDAEAAVNQDPLTIAAVNEIVKWGADRKKWLIFCAGVHHAGRVCEEIKSRGVECNVIVGETQDRGLILEDFKRGTIRALTNCDVLTTGFDDPSIDMIVLLRGTKSAGLFMQMVGRGLRKHEAKHNCIAEGELVLTDKGLVPIEGITLEHKVWDGCNWVSHCGIVFRGEQEIITYAGLTATKDHQVWTEEGWRSFGDCSEQQIAIAITGDGRRKIKLSQGCFRQSVQGGQSQVEDATLLDDRMSRMQKTRNQIVSFYQKGFSWLSKMWTKAQYQQALFGGSEMAFNALYCGQAAMYQQERFCVESIRRERGSISFQKSKCYGQMDVRQPGRVKSRASNRSYRQQRTLCSWKLTLLNAISKLGSHLKKFYLTIAAQIQARTSSNKICRFDIARFFGERDDVQTDREEVLQEVVQTKRKVWDILNAGPLHRFTVQGLLVSNCLVLDFCGNLDRFGPIDCIKVKKVKGKARIDKIPCKKCPECGDYVPIKTTDCECGYKFEMLSKVHEAEASEAPVLSEVVEMRVVDTVYKRHKKEGGRDSLRVDYICQREDKHYQERISEFVCLEHDGWARFKALEWWDKRCDEPLEFEPDIQTALEEVRRLKIPKSIVAKKDGKYWRVQSVTFRTEEDLERGDIIVEELGINI